MISSVSEESSIVFSVDFRFSRFDFLKGVELSFGRSIIGPGPGSSKSSGGLRTIKKVFYL